MPGGLSQDGGQEDSLKMEGARRTLLRWREPWRKRRVPEKEVQQEGLRPLQPVCRRGFKGSA